MGCASASAAGTSGRVLTRMAFPASRTAVLGGTGPVLAHAVRRPEPRTSTATTPRRGPDQDRSPTGDPARRGRARAEFRVAQRSPDGADPPVAGLLAGLPASVSQPVPLTSPTTTHSCTRTGPGTYLLGDQLADQSMEGIGGPPEGNRLSTTLACFEGLSVAKSAAESTGTVPLSFSMPQLLTAPPRTGRCWTSTASRSWAPAASALSSSPTESREAPGPATTGSTQRLRRTPLPKECETRIRDGPTARRAGSRARSRSAPHRRGGRSPRREDATRP